MTQNQVLSNLIWSKTQVNPKQKVLLLQAALILLTLLTLFRSGGYQIDTCLPFSLYWLHGFRSESEQPDRNRVKELRDHRGIIFASLYTIIKKQNGRYLFIGAKSMPYHWSKKVLYLPYLSFETKKSFLVGRWWWWVRSDFSVSLCPFLNFSTQAQNEHRDWQKQHQL